MDRIAALLLLALSAPLLAVIAWLIRRDSPGGALFVDERVGYGGKPFRLFKFRTMVDGADSLLDARGCVQSDRVTRVGRWLRRSSLDELPQLLNILRGEMSFIGPRPTRADHARRYTPQQRRRLLARPGVTGWAQVSGRNTIPWSRRIELDVQYVDRYSLWLDAKIALKTVHVVLFGAGMVMDRNPEQMDDLAADDSSTHAGRVSVVTGRAEPALVGRFRKDLSEETFLQSLNASLAPLEAQGMQTIAAPRPVVHVIGAPRSGTTVTTQLLAGCLDAGYVNNLIASFWRAPLCGIRLSQKLLPGGRPASFESDFGRTQGITEPHEFGYFWADLLGRKDMAEPTPEQAAQVDWQRFRETLANMADAFGKPLVLKSFLLAWHVQQVVEAMPDSLFVWVRRDPVKNALSLLRAREKQLGTIDAWISMKPRQYEWLRRETPAMQAAGQVFFVEQAIARQARLAGDSHVMEVNHDELCRHPGVVVDAVADWLAARGHAVERIRDAPARLDGGTPSATGGTLRTAVAAAWNELERGHIDEDGRRTIAA